MYQWATILIRKERWVKHYMTKLNKEAMERALATAKAGAADNAARDALTIDTPAVCVLTEMVVPICI